MLSVRAEHQAMMHGDDAYYLLVTYYL